MTEALLNTDIESRPKNNPKVSIDRPKNILFLDIDGVCNRTDKFGFLETLPAPGMSYPYLVELNIVKVLEYVLEQIPELKIVFTSTWRDVCDTREEFARIVKIDASRIHEDWRTISFVNRRLEVEDWLDHHPEVDTFVVLDDEHKEFFKGCNFVQTDPKHGMTLHDLKKVLRIFKCCVDEELTVYPSDKPIDQ
jgi:hypothetical protein